jgi:hypothetical protein
MQQQMMRIKRIIAREDYNIAKAAASKVLTRIN